MLRRTSILLLFTCISILSFAQNKFAGRVLDSDNNEPLAFVNIIYNSSNLGTTTDLDGYFTIDAKDKIEFLEVSYLGYSKLKIGLNQIQGKGYLEILLHADAFQLSEVTVLPGENPAHRIIKEVVANSKKNNPEKMRSFSYVSYNKMYFTIDMEDLPESNDTLPQADTVDTDISDNGMSMTEFFSEQHLFITESITERRFKFPDNNKEEILAHRMSGLSTPAFSLITTQFQSFSFYKDYINLMDKKYLSPISKGSTNKYFFLIEDTMYNERADTIFIISFRPYKGKNFEGLKGILHINSNGYAIQNVSAIPYDPTGTFNINIQQKYELIDSVQWFPVQLNTTLVMNLLQVSDNSTKITSNGDSGDDFLPLVGIGKSYLTDISLNPEYKRREFSNLELEISEEANERDSEYWVKYRHDSLTEKDIRTYEVIDSIGKEANLDRTMQLMEVLATGSIPYKFINIDPSKILWYNNYEGYRLGLGLSTNDKMLPWMSIGGYFGYGFRDNSWKYGGHVEFNIHKNSNTKLRFGYKQDLEFSDDHTFYVDRTSFSLQNARDFFLNEMDSVRSYYSTFKFTSFKYLHTKVEFNYDEKWIINQNRYDFLTPINQHYFNSEVGLFLRYAYKEKFLQTPYGNKISMGTKYPVLYFNVKKGVKFEDASNDYLKTEAKITKRITFRGIGDTYLSVSGGMVNGDIPYSELYYGPGSYSWLNIDNSFNTMRINEFVSQRFASFFFRHDFGSLLFKTKNWSPKLAVVSSVGWGDNSFVGDIQNDYYAKKMNLGYYESGIQINNIFKLSFQGYGLGVYYRYGPYSRGREIENWAFKFNLTIVL